MQGSKVILVLGLVLALPVAALGACFVHGALALPVPLGTCTTVHQAPATSTPVLATGLFPAASFVTDVRAPQLPTRFGSGVSRAVAPAGHRQLHRRLRI